MDNTIYNRTIFKRFFEENNEQVMAWADNVFEKIAAPGILPTFINKDNEDFKAFWESVCHFFAIIVLYGRKYNEIDTNQILFEMFVENRGLVTNKVDTIPQMQYLFNNYIAEYQKRGRMDIVSKEGVILGELLRLIGFNSLDEFIFNPLMSRDTGWTMGFSSPTWERTDTVLNTTKGYETTVSVENLAAYPLINPTGVIQVSDVDNEGNPIQVMSFSGDVMTGISSEEDKSKLMIVSEDVPYQISFKIKASSVNQDLGLSFGVQVYDSMQRPTSCIETIGITESNYFTPDGSISLFNPGVYYEFRATISKKNRSFVDKVSLNFLNGRGLKMTEGINYLSLYLVQDRTVSSVNIFIYDIKIKPLYLPFTQGQLGGKAVIASYYKNNMPSSLNSVNSFIKTYLLSFKNIFVSQPIQPIQLNTVKFKVSSERKLYVDAAIITVKGQTLITDLNGEASIDLYPGDYLFSVEKEKFISIIDKVLSVEEKENQIEYVLLKGELYERKVTFLVQDVKDVPVKGATVTFNDQFGETAADGTISFYAFPGLYTYSVIKNGYYDLNKSVLVQDDMVEEATLTKIPVSDVTFIVKNGLNPIAGALVTLTPSVVNSLPGIANSPITSQSGWTDDTGSITFMSVVNGQYTYTIEKQDWLPKNETIDVQETQTININLEPVPTYTFTFVVKGKNPFTQQETVMVGASVVFAGVTKSTDIEGKAVFILKGGKYDYTVSANEYVTQKVTGYAGYADVTIPITLIQNQYNVNFTITGIGNTPLKNATLKVSGKNYVTDDKGKVSILLPNGTYDWEASYPDYKSKNATFVVNKMDVPININLSQVEYNLTFTVTEDGSISSGASVYVSGTGYSKTLTTNSSGQATFSVPKGSFTYLVTKTYYGNQSGSVDIVGSPVSRSVALIRNKVTVTFEVLTDTNAPIEGALVTCNGSSKTTGSAGKTEFSLPVGRTYSAEASKLPDFSSVSQSVNVGQSDLTQKFILTNKVYDLTFKVFRPNGTALSGASITCNGSTKTTNSSGIATFNGVKNGSYPYSISKSGFNSQAGTSTVSGANKQENITMAYNTTSLKIYVYCENEKISGATVNYQVVESDTNVKILESSGTTDSSGSVTIQSSTIGTVDFYVEYSKSLTLEGQHVSMTATSKSVYLKEALIISMSQKYVPSISSGIYDWSGLNLRIEPYSGSSVSVSFNGTTAANYVKSVIQWPKSFTLSADYMFKNSTLSSCVSGAVPTTSARGFFYGCKNLSSLSGLSFNCSDAYEFAYASGVSSVPSYLFGSSVSNCEKAFRECKSLTSINAYAFGSGTSNLNTCFRYCDYLTSVNASAFASCSSCSDFGGLFQNCTSLSSLPSGLFSNCRSGTYFAYFAMESKVSSIPSGLFSSTRGTDFTQAFYKCTYLSSVGSNAFPSTAQTMSACFSYCSSLTDIMNLRFQNHSGFRTWYQTFAYSGVRNVPSSFFYGQSNLTSVAGCFKGCSNLRSADASTSGGYICNIFHECPNLTNFEECFMNCSNMEANSNPSVWVGNPPTKYSNPYAYLFAKAPASFNMNRMFYGCSSYKNVVSAGYSGYTGIYILYQGPIPSGHSQTFYGCTQMGNYSNIPSDWK